MQVPAGGTIALLERLRQTGEPVVLVINDQARFSITDEGSFQQLLKLVDRLETIDGVKQSIASFERGEGRPASEALDALRKRHGIPS